MPPAKYSRRPPLSRSLPCFLPSLIAVFVAIWIPPAWERYSLLLLLIGASLSMAAVCHAIGFGCEPTFARTALRRGSAHLIALAIHTAIVFLLVAWPLMALSQAPSLAAALALAVALVIALLVLWRFWPVFGLVFAWDDAFPAGEEHSWITAALARSLAFARHLTRGRDLFLTHFLPASLAQLAIAFGALSLAGMGANLPDEIRTASLFLFAVLVLPLCSLVVADRTLRLLFDGRVRRFTPPSSPPGPKPTPPEGGRRSDETSAAHVETESGAAAAEAAAEKPDAPAQAVLDENLLAAARDGNVAAAMDWLAQGANPDAMPPAGARDQRSALVLAAELPDTHLLRALIAKGADVNRAHAGLTPLLATTRACHEGRPEMVTSLIANGADPARADADGNTPLHHAALCAEPAVAAILIDAQAPLEARNREQATPLATAASAANWPVLRFLAEHGAHADAAMPAAAGIAEDDPEGVRILLKHKGRATAVDALGRSALLHAARENHIEITRVLLDANADVALADRYGTTPLMEAARAGAAGVVALLAGKKPDVNACDQHGRTALMLACQSPRANAACVRALLELGADPARKGSDGRSAIDQACASGRWDLVALMDPDAALPASHARGNEPDPGADTPQHLLDALRFAHWSVVARFEERVRTWPAAELAALYLDLADHADATPRAWLLEHGLLEQGLEAEARLDDASRLFDALLDHLPASNAAVRQLLDAGATPAGAGRFGQALARLDDREGAALALAMLERGADAFGADEDNRTPLHHASRPALLPVLDALLARGADPNARDRVGATPLHVALDGNPAEALPLVKSLIAHGADPESPAASGETPLGLALARDATKLEYWLRWNGWALPRRPLRDEDLPAAAADPDAVARLLELGLPVDARDSRGATALLRASGAGALQSVQRLLAAHADPKLTVDTGASPLSAAVSARQPDIARALVAAGVPVDLRHADDVTALMIAAALGHPDMVAVLRELGAQAGLVDARGQTALHAAARFCFDSRDSLRCRRLLDALLQDAASVDIADRSGATPLLVLLGVHTKPGADCDGTHLGALVPAMLDSGAGLDQADEHGVTALHACAMHATFEPARALLQRGANREARDCMQRTPSDVARVLGYVDLAMELAPRRGAPLNAPVVTPVMTHPE
ncbi:MAG TPA: ankyrin repeat domain-containing protein [Rhodanobacteraceae bacterium]|nr:ankyrin repeat domain-containing protein [Rhodanobacteraceae bacterium]